MRFLKEFIIVFLVILFVISMEFITKRITEEFVEKIDKKIGEVEESLETADSENKIEELVNLWKNEEVKLEYYMEHQELEDISVKIINTKSNIKNGDLDEAREQIDEVKFRVQHIKNKQKLELKNIF